MFEKVRLGRVARQVLDGAIWSIEVDGAVHFMLVQKCIKEGKGPEPAYLQKDGSRYVEDNPMTCFKSLSIPSNGMWQGDDLLKYTFPLFLAQVILVVLIIRVFMFLLRPLRQPRVVPEILCGLLLGPSGLGRIIGEYTYFLNGKYVATTGRVFWYTMFPDSSITVFETLSYIGIIYYTFLVGLEVDLRMFKRTGKKAVMIALTSIAVPFLIAYSVSKSIGNITAKPHKVQSKLVTKVHMVGQPLFLAISMSLTDFPVVASILTENKLINGEIGRVAMSSSIIIDIVMWVALAGAIPLSDITYAFINLEADDPSLKTAKAAPLYIFISSIVFLAVSFLLVRPAIIRLMKKRREGESFKQSQICMVLIAVLAFALVTEMIGAHAVFGSLVLGLIIPSGTLATTLIDSLDDFVSGILVPMFYVISGLRTNIPTLFLSADDYKALIFVIIGTIGAKVISAFLISMFSKMPPNDGITLGLLLNSKGLMQIIVLNIARDLEVLDQRSFSIMVFATLLMTSIISPLVNFIYMSARGFTRNKYTTFDVLWKSSTELRIVACLHTLRQVPGIISLVEIAKPSKDTPMSIYAFNLVELTGRASAMLIVNSAGNTTRTQAQAEQINTAFKNYEKKHNSVLTETITTISPYDTMHEDICKLADEKHSTFIILPFHKHQAIDGTMETINVAHRQINQNVLVNAPCTTGILVDRGLGASGIESADQHIALLFFGGQDDREALSFVRRISHKQNIRLDVLRIFTADTMEEPTGEDQPLTIFTHKEKEKQIDDDYVNRFRKTIESIESITYNEIAITNIEEMTIAIRSMESNNGLFVVGRRPNVSSSLTIALAEWSEFPELGLVGDLLASSDFKTTMSVLIVQQFTGKIGRQTGSAMGTPTSMHNNSESDPFSASSSKALR
ncbi:hypothetical protein Sjap_025230 [Stephania japonica]|uniref:Cation/H+ exchanger domain-containing protein n=1 Tax=Stephania japonica TaxID=461633 RepID=A0AAP0E977_9MAGN